MKTKMTKNKSDSLLVRVVAPCSQCNVDVVCVQHGREVVLGGAKRPGLSRPVVVLANNLTVGLAGDT